MHQLILIAAMSTTTGLFGGKHCGGKVRHARPVEQGCYSAAPCGSAMPASSCGAATYAAPQAAPMAYPASPQATPSASPVPAAPVVPPAPPAPPAPSSANFGPSPILAARPR